MKMSLLLSIAIVFFFLLSVQEINAQEPFNDVCVAAKPLTPNAPMTTGSTVDAEESSWCNSEVYPYWGAKYGAWYSVTGTGNIMMVTTCFPETDFDTYFSLQTTCEEWLYCVDLEDEVILPGDEPCLYPGGGTFKWSTVKDETYLVRVSNLDYEMGNFGLALYEFPAPENSQCIDAAPVTSLGTVLTGTTWNTTWSFDCSSSSITPEYDRTAWYVVAGTGNQMTASTCHPQTDYMSKLNMLWSCADEFSCVDYTLAQCTDNNDNGMLLTWSSVKDQTYMIAVSGVNQTVGNFGFSVVDDTEPPPETPDDGDEEELPPDDGDEEEPPPDDGSIGENPAAIAGITIASVVVVGAAATAISYAFGFKCFSFKFVFKDCCSRRPKEPKARPPKEAPQEKAIEEPLAEEAPREKAIEEP